MTAHIQLAHVCRECGNLQIQACGVTDCGHRIASVTKPLRLNVWASVEATWHMLMRYLLMLFHLFLLISALLMQTFICDYVFFAEHIFDYVKI